MCSTHAAYRTTEPHRTVLNQGYDFILRLPGFKGKTRIESLFRGLLKPHVSKIAHGLVMDLDPDEWPQIDLRAKGCLEPRTTALFERILRPGDTFVDVGAHVGYHSLLARHLVGENGRIFSLDPQPHNCAKLLANAELNSFANIVVMAAAAGDADDFIALKSQSKRDRSRLTLAGPGVNDGALTFIVPKITLSWLFKTYELHRVNILKIDVEGFELEVLQGARDAIELVDNIVLEVLPEERIDKGRAIEQMLCAHGFHVFDVEGIPWQPGQTCVENNIWARRIDQRNDR
jgi:FkbM family methyltransferase